MSGRRVGTAHQNSGPVDDGGQCSPYGAAGLLLLMVFAVFRMPPWLPLFVHESNGVDPSWQMLLNEAGSNGWVFGRDLFFTYGPFGFIHARMYHPETWTVLAAVWVGISVIMADLVWRVSSHGRLSSVGRTLFGIAMLEFMSRDAMAVCFGLHALVFLEGVGVSREDAKPQRAVESLRYFAPSRLCVKSFSKLFQRIRLALPILLLAALPWAKFSYFVTVSFLGCLLVAVALLQRRFPWRATLLFAACPLAWVMSGATLAECGQFIGTGFQLAGGYSAAMGLGPDSTAGLIVVVTSACVVLLLPIWCSSRIQNNDWRLRVLTMLFLHGLLFIVWKSCFVRYHAERIPVFLGTILPLLAYRMSCSHAGDRDSVQVGGFSRLLHSVNRQLVMPGMFAVLFVMMLAGTVERVRPLTPGETITHAASPFRDQVLAVVQTMKEPDWRQSTHNDQLEEIRRANPIPDIDGTVDVFPSKLAVAFAHGLKLRPRPVLQGYAAFTSELIERDAEHFRGPNAPDEVLISVGEIDGRLPTMEDSGAWLELVKNFELTDSRRDLLRLSKRDGECVEFVTWGSGKEVPWGEAVHVPDRIKPHRPVVCSIRVKPGESGRLASILYRLPELVLKVQLVDGSIHSFRLLPGLDERRFLISPLIETRADLVELWRPVRDLSMARDSEKNVASISCEISGETWEQALFEPTITVSFCQLAFVRTPPPFRHR